MDKKFENLLVRVNLFYQMEKDFQHVCFGKRVYSRTEKVFLWTIYDFTGSWKCGFEFFFFFLTAQKCLLFYFTVRNKFCLKKKNNNLVLVIGADHGSASNTSFGQIIPPPSPAATRAANDLAVVTKYPSSYQLCSQVFPRGSLQFSVVPPEKQHLFYIARTRHRRMEVWSKGVDPLRNFGWQDQEAKIRSNDDVKLRIRAVGPQTTIDKGKSQLTAKINTLVWWIPFIHNADIQNQEH